MLLMLSKPDLGQEQTQVRGQLMVIPNSYEATLIRVYGFIGLALLAIDLAQRQVCCRI